MAGNSTHERRSAAAKVIAIICAFAYRRELSNAQIARLTGLPASTVHRLLGELVVGGMVERTTRRQYRVGPKLQAIAASASHALNDAGPNDHGTAGRRSNGHQATLAGLRLGTAG
jgi:hypothetical protein